MANWFDELSQARSGRNAVPGSISLVGRKVAARHTRPAQRGAVADVDVPDRADRADRAHVAMQVTAASTNYQAALRTTAMISQLSLRDFLR